MAGGKSFCLSNEECMTSSYSWASFQSTLSWGWASSLAFGSPCSLGWCPLWASFPCTLVLSALEHPWCNFSTFYAVQDPQKSVPENTHEILFPSILSVTSVRQVHIMQCDTHKGMALVVNGWQAWRWFWETAVDEFHNRRRQTKTGGAFCCQTWYHSVVADFPLPLPL